MSGMPPAAMEEPIAAAPMPAPMPPPQAPMQNGQEKSAVIREPPDVAESRRQGVAKLVAEVQLDRAHWKADFERMKADMDFARGWQWIDQAGWDDERYVANVVQRHINQRVSALYAKNPTFVARRRERMDFAVWDGDPQSLMMAQQAMQGAMMGMVPPAAAMQAMELLADVQQGMATRKMLDNVAKTLLLVWRYYVGEQAINFKSQMKQLVRRAITCGIGYLRLGFQRAMEKRPEIALGIADASARLAHIESLTADLQDNEIDESSAQMEELRKALAAMQAEPEVIVREGVIFDYPQSWSIIPDRMCRQLKGFIGCRRVTQEYLLTPEQVQEIYGVDIKRSFQSYTWSQGAWRYGSAPTPPGETPQGLACILEVYEPKSGTVSTVCEGWPDYLREPGPPSPAIEGFYPWIPLSFNDGEHQSKIFPVSDVTLLRSQQREYNRCREGLRRHRIANRPGTASATGKLSDTDKENLQNRPDNCHVEVQGLAPGEKIDDVLTPLKGAPIDPGLYDTTPIFEDILRIVGSQEANLGGTSAATATESSIAESSRLSSLQSNIDDLDDFLSVLGRLGGQVCLAEVSPEEAKRIAGIGGVWPQVSRQEIVEEMYLEVAAGSSGRPNKAQELQNMNLVMPYLMQIPGIPPKWLAEQVITRLDDRIDISTAYDAMLPSITAMNQIAQPQSAGVAPPEGEEAEAEAGNDNAPKPGQGAQANASPTIPNTRPAVAIPPSVAARGMP